MFKKAHAAALLVLLACAHASAQQPPAEWEKLSAPAGRFSVLMPAKPDLETKEVETPIGKVMLHAYSVTSGEGYFFASYADYPVEPKDAAQIGRVLEGVQAGVLKGVGVEAADAEKKISLGGIPGREFSAKKDVQGITMVVSFRIFLDGRRLYQLAVGSQETGAPSPQIAKFFTSFDITK